MISKTDDARGQGGEKRTGRKTEPGARRRGRRVVGLSGSEGRL